MVHGGGGRALPLLGQKQANCGPASRITLRVKLGPSIRVGAVISLGTELKFLERYPVKGMGVAGFSGLYQSAVQPHIQTVCLMGAVAVHGFDRRTTSWVSITLTGKRVGTHENKRSVRNSKSIPDPENNATRSTDDRDAVESRNVPRRGIPLSPLFRQASRCPRAAPRTRPSRLNRLRAGDPAEAKIPPSASSEIGERLSRAAHPARRRSPDRKPRRPPFQKPPVRGSPRRNPGTPAVPSRPDLYRTSRARGNIVLPGKYANGNLRERLACADSNLNKGPVGEGSKGG